MHVVERGLSAFQVVALMGPGIVNHSCRWTQVVPGSKTWGWQHLLQHASGKRHSIRRSIKGGPEFHPPHPQAPAKCAVALPALMGTAAAMPYCKMPPWPSLPLGPGPCWGQGKEGRAGGAWPRCLCTALHSSWSPFLHLISCSQWPWEVFIHFKDEESETRSGRKSK